MIVTFLFINILSAIFFYCQAIMSGLGKKRWTFLALLLGPLAWPMFNNNKRMKVYRQKGIAGLIFKA